MMNRVLRVLICLLLAVSFSSGLGKHSDPSRRIEIVAHRYAYTPPEITLTKGEPVTLVLTSEDVTHGLMIPELNIKAEIHKGQPTEITITPEQVGTFKGQCAYFCGPGHGSMRITVHVQE